MKTPLCLVVLGAALSLCADPVKIIFDTDMLGDKGENEWVPDEEKGPHLRIAEKLDKVEVGKIVDELICRKPFALK